MSFNEKEADTTILTLTEEDLYPLRKNVMLYYITENDQSQRDKLWREATFTP